MPRMPRNAPGGQVYHVLNRASGRLRVPTGQAARPAWGKNRLRLPSHENRQARVVFRDGAYNLRTKLFEAPDDDERR